MEIKTEEKLKDSSRYVPTGNMIVRQMVGIAIVPVVTEYHALEFYDRKKGRNAHSAFPVGVTDDVNYDESIKAVLFLLNSRRNVSLEKTAQFVCDVTDGAFSPSVGMISGLCREFSLKSKKEQDSLFKALLDAPVMHLRMVKYKHNHLLFLSNPFVEPDNNLCERKARVLKGKINQAISLRSFERLSYFCECLSVLDHFAAEMPLFQALSGILLV